ncbi:flavodoxin FldA [Sodalis-like secondary symbiont of Drepanosiphum platanoidis]|uniref:flavodoxin FldA n=1 Tax=Sodalis-like secondary symbiont of Drepanosiphum platanoidis TaxID=2994493 RepID=UPI00346477C5
MKKIGIFFGSDTGNTEYIAFLIQKILGKDIVDVYDISKSYKKDIEKYKFIIFGIPTWYYGEAQCDWDDFFPIFKTINFSKKIIALFGCGDQEDYSEYFCDAMGTLYKNIINKNKIKLVGKWSTSGYYFDESKGLINKKNFIGLAIDQDRQSNLTKIRVKKWINQIKDETNLF